MSTHRLTRAASTTFDTPRGRVTLHRGEALEPHAALKDLPAAQRKLFTTEKAAAEPEPAAEESVEADESTPKGRTRKRSS